MSSSSIRNVADIAGDRLNTCFFEAVRVNALETTQLLLDLGANVRHNASTTPGVPLTALMIAASRGTLAMCQLLIRHGADPDDGLQHALFHCRRPIALYLVASGADAGRWSTEYLDRRVEDVPSLTAMAAAVHFGDLDVLRDTHRRLASTVDPVDFKAAELQQLALSLRRKNSKELAAYLAAAASAQFIERALADPPGRRVAP